MAKVAVYSPEGKREVHTLANARDLVQGAGWTWNPGVESNPVAKSPIQKPAIGKEPAQKVLDSVKDAAPTATATPDEVEDDADVVIDAAAPVVEAEEEVVDAAAPAATVEEEAVVDAAAPNRRRRKA